MKNAPNKPAWTSHNQHGLPITWNNNKTTYVTQTIVMRCTIWYHFYNLKNVKNTHGGVLLLVKLQAYGVFSGLIFSHSDWIRRGNPYTEGLWKILKEAFIEATERTCASTQRSIVVNDALNSNVHVKCKLWKEWKQKNVTKEKYLEAKRDPRKSDLQMPESQSKM